MNTPKNNFSIPPEIIAKLEQEIDTTAYGSIKLEIIRRDFLVVRYVIHREQSLLPSDIEGGNNQ